MSSQLLKLHLMEVALCVCGLHVTIGMSSLLQQNCLTLMALNQLKDCREAYSMQIYIQKRNDHSFVCEGFVSTTPTQVI